MVFALHSDFSLVLTPIHPLMAAWIAVRRIALDGETVVAPGERIGRERALRAITIDAAHVLGRDREIGSIRPVRPCRWSSSPAFSAPARPRCSPICWPGRAGAASPR